MCQLAACYMLYTNVRLLLKPWRLNRSVWRWTLPMNSWTLHKKSCRFSKARSANSRRLLANSRENSSRQQPPSWNVKRRPTWRTRQSPWPTDSSVVWLRRMCDGLKQSATSRNRRKRCQETYFWRLHSFRMSAASWSAIVSTWWRNTGFRSCRRSSSQYRWRPNSIRFRCSRTAHRSRRGTTKVCLMTVCRPKTQRFWRMLRDGRWWLIRSFRESSGSRQVASCFVVIWLKWKWKTLFQVWKIYRYDHSLLGRQQWCWSKCLRCIYAAARFTSPLVVSASAFEFSDKSRVIQIDV